MNFTFIHVLWKIQTNSPDSDNLLCRAVLLALTMYVPSLTTYSLLDIFPSYNDAKYKNEIYKKHNES